MDDTYYMEIGKLQRRHHATVFAALFFDKETVREEDIRKIISEVALFFGLPQPEIHDKCDTFAEVLLKGNADQFELSYNIQMLQDVGINNKDAFTLCFVHEIAHQLLFRHRFMLFCSERWVHELAADLTAGLYAERHHLATGKYKYALSIQRSSITHPQGKLRQEIVELGREQLETHNADGKELFRFVQSLMPLFVYGHYDQLVNDWRQILHDLEFPPPPPEPVNIDALPNSNLLKQAVLKYRKLKQEKDERNS